MTRAALYSRVSTLEQSSAAQTEALARYAAARRWEAQASCDHVSGAKASRPALDRMLEDVRARRVDVVVVTKLDRLARSVRQLVELAAELEALGVDLVVLDQGIDTSTPTGRLLFHTLAAVAEFERDLIRERVAAGIASARRRGVKFGRRERLDPEGRARVRRLRASGHTLRSIAALLEVGRGTVERALR